MKIKFIFHKWRSGILIFKDSDKEKGARDIFFGISIGREVDLDNALKPKKSFSFYLTALNKNVLEGTTPKGWIHLRIPLK